MQTSRMGRRAFLGGASATLAVTGLAGRAGRVAAAARPVIVGLDTDQSGITRPVGESIRRGATLAIAKINRAGGVLGRPLALVARDNRRNPARGIDNIDELAGIAGLVAVIGGAHTPTAIAELEAIHRHKIVYLGPWAAGTRIVENDYNPSYVFRISAPDHLVGPFLIGKAVERGFERPGLLLWNTAWGRAHEIAITSAIAKHGLGLAGTQWFNTGQDDMAMQIDRLIDNGADVIMLVRSEWDGVATMRAMIDRPVDRRRPIISHWGITTGDHYATLGEKLREIDLTFLQTFSFLRPPVPDKAAELLAAYCEKFPDCPRPEAISVPSALAQTYDIVQLFALAVEKAGSLARHEVRDAMERLDSFAGVTQRYERPFTPDRHDGLDAKHFMLSRFGANGAILPLSGPGG